MRERLTPNGVVAINVGTPPGETKIVERIAATMRASLPAVQVSAYDEFNWVVIGLRRPGRRGRDARAPAGRLAARLHPPPRTISRAPSTPVAPGGDAMTDDLAPVESLTDGALLAYLRRGAPEVDPLDGP